MRSLILVGVVSLCTFVIGGFLGLKKMPPVRNLADLVEAVERGIMALRLDGLAYRKWEYGRHVHHGEWIDKLHPNIVNTDVSALIGIRSPEEARDRRRRITEWMWRGKGLPVSRMPDEVVTNIDDADFADLSASDLERIDKLIIRMPHGVTSIAYVFRPRRPNGSFAIYHQGHYGHFRLGKNVIRRFLSDGYVIVGMSMPMLGLNTGPDPDIPRFGHIVYQSHDNFIFFDTPTFNPMAFFVEPIITVVNYLRRDMGGCAVGTGVSTGGWLVTLAAAVDVRICRTYPVAGSLPAYIRMAPPNVPNIGDYSEMRPELLAIANVLEIYVLAANGKNRKLMTIYNQFDNCCYRGIGVLTFREPLGEAVAQTGAGEADVYLDSSHIGHLTSAHGLDVIMKDVEEARRNGGLTPRR